MNNEDNLVIHTFNTDIEEELKKKDANILDITNANNNHIEPSEPPNYRILFIALILSVSMALIYYAINFYKLQLSLKQSIFLNSSKKFNYVMEIFPIVRVITLIKA